MREPAIADFKAHPEILLLEGAVQHYAWGGCEFIPRLIGQENTSRQPYAELWIGDHPVAAASAWLGHRKVSLERLVSEAAEEILGPSLPPDGRQGFPFLLKILDARQMLSVQAHPNRVQAEAGYAREERQGIDLASQQRNYKDRNHKPEVHVALTDFWMLHGFRPLSELETLGETTPELEPLLCREDIGGERDHPSRLRELYQRLMTLPQEEIDAWVNPLIERLERLSPVDKDQPDFWVLRAAGQCPLPDGHRDRGLLAIYLLNLVHLRPGQGTFQPPGTLHAYLEGTTIELMARSDNVLRGGLTPKHVDTAELMKILVFESRTPEILRGHPVSATERIYHTPAEEFELSRIRLEGGMSFGKSESRSVELFLLIEGEAMLHSGDETRVLKRGAIFLVPFEVKFWIEPIGPAGCALFKAALPRSSQ